VGQGPSIDASLLVLRADSISIRGVEILSNDVVIEQLKSVLSYMHVDVGEMMALHCDCRIEKKHEEREFMISLIEIYNEVVRDLLSTKNTPLRLHDDPERGSILKKFTEENLRNWGHLQELLLFCEAQRQVGETYLNEKSPRSHQIIKLTIESSARKFLGKGNSAILLKKKDLQIEKLEKEVKELAKQRDLAQSRVEDLLCMIEEDQKSIK
ncbi:hypothetical protein S83_001314, partial [Arachis hypogaea]